MLPDNFARRFLGDPRNNDEFRSAGERLAYAFQSVRTARSEILTYDDQGKPIASPVFLAGFRVGSVLSSMEARELDRTTQLGLEEKMKAFELPTSTRFSFYDAGCLKYSFFVPIVEIPKIDWDKNRITPEQQTILKGLYQRVMDAGSVRLYYDLMSVELPGGFVSDDLPEGILMEEDPDYKLEIYFQPGFTTQREYAQKVLGTFLNDPLLTKKRQFNGRSLAALQGHSNS